MMATVEGSDCAALETVGVGAEEGIAPKKNGVNSCGQIEVSSCRRQLLPPTPPLRPSPSPPWVSASTRRRRASHRKAARRARGGAAGVVPRLQVLRCMAASDAAQLKSAREDIKEILKTTYCHPHPVRLGWHDSGTYDKNIEEWPQRGGADGSLRFDPELSHGANAGLTNALKLIQPIKDKYPGSRWPKTSDEVWAVDITAPEQCPPEGRLPDVGPCIPAEHLRDVFYRMGLDDKEIVALSGAHTLGRNSKYCSLALCLVAVSELGAGAKSLLLSLEPPSSSDASGEYFFSDYGLGILEPIKAGIMDAKLGVGKQEQDDFFTASANLCIIF
ncbi:thylakoid-bound ascorbate peroxidase [Hordeum vulgare]|nr:thylakoid-bound ascorbate peroxidase [Hordeum vulgare]